MPKKANIQRRADGLYKRSITIGRKPDGKPIRKYIYAKTIKELETKTAEYERQLRHGTLSADENATFGDIAAVWLSDYKPMIGDRQRQDYAGILKNHLCEIAAVKVKDLKPNHLQVIINRLAASGYSTKTLQSIRQTAVQVVNLAMKNDVVFRNVFTFTDVPSIEPEERLPITDGQKELVLRSWQGHRMGIPALVMLYCGLRRGEIIALTWRDVDLQAKTITVNKAADFAVNAATIKSPKTAAGVRVVPIPNALVPALMASRRRASMMVCPSAKGGIMSLSAYQSAWNSYMHYLNIQAGGRDASRSHPKVIACEPFTAHQLRHTYATMLYDAGVDVKTAQELLGHADLQVTMKIYTHLSNAKREKSIDALNAHIGAEMPLAMC